MINIVTALKIEALPIIEHFKLKNRNSIWQNEKFNLIITGSGKIKSAINTALLLKDFPYFTINFGIAGSNCFEVAEGFFIDKIVDTDTGFEYYPDFFKESTTLYTTSKVGKYYSLVDMEGSGFFEAAYKFLSVEKIALYKIVSDTPSTQPKNIPELIKRHLFILEELYYTPQEDPIKEALKKAKELLYLTKTQENELKNILTYLYTKNRPFPKFEKMNKKETKEFLRELKSSVYHIF
jgi:hypothetical protein